MTELQSERQIYSVSQLTRFIKGVLEETFSRVWVEGEISNFVKHSSGHMYFSLKDESSIIGCVLFRGSAQKLKFTLESGMKVLLFGRVGVYDKRGQYQLYVEKAEPRGLGALQLAFEQLKERLKKEGLFDAGAKREIPHLPERIGIVTSPTGAAIRDILKVTRERFGNVELIINPVRVQGDAAANEIARAIREFNEFNAVDVLIVGRGGGSLEDLWAFNEESVARAIYESKIPIISAVGHEVDVTISDFVADMRAATPSTAAEMVIPKKEDLTESVQNALIRLKNALMGLVDLNEEKLLNLKMSRAFTKPYAIIEQYEQRLDELTKGAALRVGHMIQISEANCKSFTARLQGLSPLGVLRRGYSITENAAKREVIKDARSVNTGDLIRTRLNRGSIISRVDSINKGE